MTVLNSYVNRKNPIQEVLYAVSAGHFCAHVSQFQGQAHTGGFGSFVADFLQSPMDGILGDS